MNELLDETPRNQKPAILWKPCLVTQGMGLLLALVVFVTNSTRVQDGIFGASMVLLLLSIVNLLVAIVLFIMSKKEYGFAFLIMFLVMGVIGFSTCLGAFTTTKFH